MRHLLSFVRCPLGYALNFVCTVAVYAERLPGLHWTAGAVGDWLAGGCEAICIRDGVQDDMLF